MSFPSLDPIEDLILSLFKHQNLFAPFVLLIIEEIGIPLPVTDAAIAYTGYQVSLGRMPYFVAFIMVLISQLIGSSILYFLSDKYGSRIIFKLGKYIDLDKKKLEIVEEKFREYGALAIIFGRHIPGFKTPITIFSGISTMKYKTFILSTALSLSFTIPLYLSLGQRLGPRTARLVHANHLYYSLAILPLLISILPFLFMRKSKSK
jgi:membrane protein DedA with SNARE-associated domain